MRKLKDFITGLFWLILSICIAAAIVVNSTLIYKKYISYFNLEKETSLTATEILSDYEKIISYINNPKLDKIQFEYFTLSKNGMSHFKDVKNIFQFIYLFIILSLLLITVLYLINMFKKKKTKLASFNYFFYCSIALVCSLIIFTLWDFNTLFKLFHSIAFTNDYWIFDVVDDSIINVLPKDFFLLCLILIFAIVLVQSISCKIVYLLKNRDSRKTCNNKLSN